MTPPLLRPRFMKMKFASVTALARHGCGDRRHDAVALFYVLELPGEEKRRRQRSIREELRRGKRNMR